MLIKENEKKEILKEINKSNDNIIFHNNNIKKINKLYENKILNEKLIKVMIINKENIFNNEMKNYKISLNECNKKLYELYKTNNYNIEIINYRNYNKFNYEIYYNNKEKIIMFIFDIDLNLYNNETFIINKYLYEYYNKFIDNLNKKMLENKKYLIFSNKHYNNNKYYILKKI